MRMFRKILPQIIASLFLAGFVVYAWTGPTQAPPNCPAGSPGCDAPINVGAGDQTFLGSKTLWMKNDETGVMNLRGAFNVRGLSQFLSDAVFDGKVGIGTVTPGAKLEINGQVKITGGLPGAGKVLTSDANGLGSWQINSWGKKVCKSDEFGKQCFPLVNKIGSTFYYINGSNIGTMQDGAIGCKTGYVLTYAHPKGLTYYLSGTCGGQGYTNSSQEWHPYCINDINDPNLNSQDCDLTSDPNCVSDGNCWYGRNPIYGPTVQAVCAQINRGSKNVNSMRDGRTDGGGVCTSVSGGWVGSFYDATSIFLPTSCCTIE